MQFGLRQPIQNKASSQQTNQFNMKNLDNPLPNQHHHSIILLTYLLDQKQKLILPGKNYPHDIELELGRVS